MRANIAWSYSLFALIIGCNTFDSRGPECETCSDGSRTRRIVPTDERSSTVQAVRPPPVSGGTLLIAKDRAIVSDPDRDRIVVVDLVNFSVQATLQLETFDEPGRLVEGASGKVHAALRGSGTVLTIDPATRSIEARTPVCGDLRGLAFDAATSTLLAACAEGALVEIQGNTIVRRTALGPDLRDVVVQGQDVYVSRFRSATILKLDATRTVVSEFRPPSVPGLVSDVGSRSSSPEGPASPALSKIVDFAPGVAWRMLPTRDGVVMVHQRATTSVVDIDSAAHDEQNAEEPSPYGGGVGSTCEGIVRPAITVLSKAGAIQTSVGIDGSVVPVDIAVSPRGEFAIANAGPKDPEAPLPSVVTEGPSGSSGGFAAPVRSFGGVTRLGAEVMGNDPLTCFGAVRPTVNEPVIAVAFDAQGRLFAQTREPSRLVMLGVEGSAPSSLNLGGESRLDTGHELFHRDGGAGIACASCHPEGGEDGRVWKFSTGERRTQPLNVGLAETAPFHWEGNLTDFGELMDDVFVKRMGGVFEAQPRVEALSSYVFAMRPPTPVRPANDPAAQRGKQTFESEDSGCSSCHNGWRLTDNRTVDIGKGKFQVPPLVGISRRAPYLHDGCAANLAARFDPTCGGNSHGSIQGLDGAALGDLIAYLESL